MFSPLRLLVRRLCRDKRGAQLVEFAIVLPILMLIVMGMVEFGRAYFSWIIITNGAREGARVAAVGGDADEVTIRVTSAISGLNVAGAPSGCPTPPAVQRAWCIDTDNLQGDPGDPVTVEVRYNFVSIVPGMGILTGPIITLWAESTMRLE